MARLVSPNTRPRRQLAASLRVKTFDTRTHGARQMRATTAPQIPAALLDGCVGVDCVVAHGIISNTHAIPKASHRSIALHCFLTAL